MAIRAEEVSLHRSGFDLLRNLSMQFDLGKVNVILGPNGAGKSSLLGVLTGETIPSSGRVCMHGLDLHQWSLPQRAQLLAVLPQHPQLNFPFTADEVVGIGRIPHRTGKHRDAEIIAEALAMLDAQYLQKRFYTQMSGGEKQHVQLARVLAQIWEPSELGGRFLVLDEPTAAFDLAHQQLTLTIVRQWASTGVGIIMVLHDLNLAAQCADNVVVLDGGLVVAQGCPEDVLTTQLIDSVFKVKSVLARHPVTQKLLVII